MSSLLLPALALIGGFTQLAVPHLSRTYTLLGLSRPAHYLHPSYTDPLDRTCALHHPALLFGCEAMQLLDTPTGPAIFAACLTSWEGRARVSTEQRAEDNARRLKGNQVPEDVFYRWDLTTDTVTPLAITGSPASPLAFHGFDITTAADGTVTVYAISHAVPSSVVEKFTYTPLSAPNTLAHTATIPLPAHIKNPNDIHTVSAATDTFYLTSDHRYSAPPLSTLETWTRRAWTSVYRHSAAAGWTTALTNIRGANGITGRGARVYIAAMLAGEVLVADIVDEETGSLRVVQSVTLEFMPDNIALTASGADLVVAGHPTPARLAGHLGRGGGAALPPPGGMVARVPVGQLGGAFYGEGFTAEPKVENVFVDLGGRWINGSSTAIVMEEGTGTGAELFVTGLIGRGILRCRDFR